MNDRKAELERKKERLRQIREEKERRRREREQADARASTLRTASGEAGSARAHDDINRQLAEIGLTPVDQVSRGRGRGQGPVGDSVCPTNVGTPRVAPTQPPRVRRT